MAEQKKSTAASKKSAADTATATVKTTASAKTAAPKKSPTKSDAPKTAGARTPTAANPGAATVSEEMRQNMIREAAYYRAMHRGFGNGAEMEDWLAAEREIDTMLGRLTR